MDIHIISLNDSERRLLAMERAAKFHYIPIFHDALDFRGIDISQLTSIFDCDKFQSVFGINITGGQIGCLISHLQLYKNLAKSSLPYHLIVEDDFIPQFNSNAARSAIEDAIELGADIILMGYSKMDIRTLKIYNLVNPILGIIHNTNYGYTIGPRYKNTTSGAVGYAVSKYFVDQMSSFNSLPWFVADEWNVYVSFGFKIVHVSPTFFSEDYQGMNSTLEAERSPQNRYIKPTPDLLYKDILKLPFRVLKGAYYRLVMNLSPFWRSVFVNRRPY
jgi:glycosyl transferase family 25